MSKQTIILYYNPEGQNVSVGKYEQYKKKKDKEKIAEFIYNRLYSRYIKPFKFDNKDYKKYYKNGFSMMANACLLIETLQSFKEGVGNSSGKSKKLFQHFFEENTKFKDFNSDEFYKNVRSGILHQGETTNGWTINRKKNTHLIDDRKSINANKFMKELEKSLKAYKNKLKKEEWDSTIWKNLHKKMQTIIENTSSKAT